MYTVEHGLVLGLHSPLVKDGGRIVRKSPKTILIYNEFPDGPGWIILDSLVDQQSNGAHQKN